MRIMDRYLFWNFIGAYLICFTSLVGLYITIDLFANADEFLEDHAGIVEMVRRASKFYSVHCFEYFATISPFITMIATMTTLASLHRQNEIVALLAAGIPTRRALMPIFAGVVVVIGLGVVNREYILPANAELLLREHDDIDGKRTIFPSICIDGDKILIRAREANREERSLSDVSVTLPETVAGSLQEIRSPKAYYEKDEATGKMGWRLIETTPVSSITPNDKIKPLEGGGMMLFSHLTFTELTRKPNWRDFASTSELLSHLQSANPKNPREIRVRIHSRLMQPFLDFLLVLLGAPLVLQWERKNLYRCIATAMVLGGCFFLVVSCANYFASFDYVEPATASWLPIFLFGPVAMSLFHNMGT